MPIQKKILIVDDEKNLLALVGLHMQMAGHAPLSADNGQAALALAEQENPDLIILDVMLPKFDGWEVCRRIRNNDRRKHVPIIMLTARGEIEDKLKSFEVGADDHIAKPFSPRELVARVNRLLERGYST